MGGANNLLGVKPVTIYHDAGGQALHTTIATRQSRKGAISTRKTDAPAFASKGAIEAVDRAMRAQTSPAPIYEGERCHRPGRWADPPRYQVVLYEGDEDRRAILDSFTKEHSAEYRAQAWIHFARRLRESLPELGDLARVDEIVRHTSHHIHQVIGSGSHDPQTYDPYALRETLDHSVAYIVVVALQDGAWHHELSYARERATRFDTVAS
jgi:2-methylcitrate dehydratase